MTDLTHQHICDKLNRRAARERDNAHMDEIEHRALPLLYAVMAAALVTVLWIATADYRDVAAHHVETAKMRIENQIISAKLAACANNGVVPFNGAMLQCKRLPLVPL